jgi:hypothetical protein
LKYFLLFIPPLAAYLLNQNTILSFSISWTSSFVYIILSITGKITPLPSDKKWSEQLFRPFIFSQILFFGYNSIANIFFFADTLGYYYFEKTNLPVDSNLLQKLSAIQNYSLIAHAAYLCGLLPNIKHYAAKTKYRINLKQHSYLIYAIILLVFAYLLKSSPLAFLGFYLNSLGLFLALFYSVYSLKNKKHLPLAIVLLSYLMLNALLSGMKENIIVIIIFLMTNLYTFYKWKPIIILSPIILIFFYYYPSINGTYRKLTWDEGMDNYDAASEVLKEDNVKNLTIAENNWGFLTTRLSEVSMAVSYFDYVPENRDYYGLDIVYDGIKLLAPRILFPDKGSPDISAMKRATDAGAISLNEKDYTSAKPQTLPDAYMSGGLFGIIITFFLFGWLTTKISLWCENLFGGYEFGSILIFQSFFSLFNKGGCFENLIGGLFWSLILIVLLHLFLVNKKILIRK